MDDKTLLLRCTQEMGLMLTEEQVDQFFLYRQLLLSWNEKMNLTAITDPTEVVLKHFADCLSLLPQAKLPQGAKVIDVGTGAGFPGIPIKIARPDLSLTLLDSLQKRITFLDEVVQSLGLTNVTLYHSRAEDGGRNPALREQFDGCVARAVASLPVLAEYCLPFLKVGGVFVALKGPDAQKEWQESQKALKVLGGGAGQVLPVQVPFTDLSHCLVVVEKTHQTPKTYPRKAGTAAKKPIQ